MADILMVVAWYLTVGATATLLFLAYFYWQNRREARRDTARQLARIQYERELALEREKARREVGRV